MSDGEGEESEEEFGKSLRAPVKGTAADACEVCAKSRPVISNLSFTAPCGN